MQAARRSRHWLVLALLLAGAVSLGMTKSASADQSLHFRQEIPLRDAWLESFDAFGSHWVFRGKLQLETKWVIRDWGDSYVAFAALIWAPGLNYKLGEMHRMDVWIPYQVAPVKFDRWENTYEARFPMEMLLRGPGGGRICPVVTMLLTPDGAKIRHVDFRAAVD